MLAKTGTRCDAEIVGLPLFGGGGQDEGGLSTLIDQSNQTGVRPAEGPWRLEGGLRGWGPNVEGVGGWTLRPDGGRRTGGGGYIL